MCEHDLTPKMAKPRHAGHMAWLLTNHVEKSNTLAMPDYQAKQYQNEPPVSEELKGLRGIDGARKRAEAANKRLQKAEKKDAPKAQGTAELLHVPRWADEVRAVPNAFLRSAVFGAVKPGARTQLKDTLMPSPEGLEVRCTGERLDQADLDTWLTVLHLCQGKSSVRTNSYQLLKTLGLTDTGKNREILEKRIKRLVGHSVEIQQGSMMYIGSLFSGAARDKETTEWLIDTNPRLTALLDGNNFTFVGWSVRHSLAGQQLAQWLHAFYSSHADPFSIRIDTLHALSGSQATVMSDFAKTLRKALEAVKSAFKEQAQPFDFSIENGLVSVNLRPSKSQRKHLLSKKKTG